MPMRAAKNKVISIDFANSGDPWVAMFFDAWATMPKSKLVANSVSSVRGKLIVTADDSACSSLQAGLWLLLNVMQNPIVG